MCCARLKRSAPRTAVSARARTQRGLGACHVRAMPAIATTAAKPSAMLGNTMRDAPPSCKRWLSISCSYLLSEASPTLAKILNFCKGELWADPPGQPASFSAPPAGRFGIEPSRPKTRRDGRDEPPTRLHCAAAINRAPRQVVAAIRLRVGVGWTRKAWETFRVYLFYRRITQGRKVQQHWLPPPGLAGSSSRYPPPLAMTLACALRLASR